MECPPLGEEKKIEERAEKLKGFFTAGWGRNAARYLKEGATIKVLIDGAPFSLIKRREGVDLLPGAPEHHEVLYEISCPAIDYLCAARTDEEAQERLAEIARRPTPEQYGRMKIEVEPSERGRIAFFWKGYFFWARRMEFFW